VTDAHLGGLVLRMVLSLAVVLGLLVLAARFFGSRAGGLRGAGGRARRAGVATPVQILARASVARGTSVTVVRACGRTMVLGVTPTAVSVLAADDAPLLDPAAALEAPAAPSPGGRTPPPVGWKPVLDALRERTVRRP